MSDVVLRTGSFGHSCMQTGLCGFGSNKIWQKSLLKWKDDPTKWWSWDHKLNSHGSPMVSQSDWPQNYNITSWVVFFWFLWKSKPSRGRGIPMSSKVTLGGFQVLRTCGLLHDPIPPLLGHANSSLGHGLVAKLSFLDSTHLKCSSFVGTDIFRPKFSVYWRIAERERERERERNLKPDYVLTFRCDQCLPCCQKNMLIPISRMAYSTWL